MNSNLPVSVCCCVCLTSLLLSSCASSRADSSGENSELEVIGPKGTVAHRGRGFSPRHTVPPEVLASARELVPGFVIEEVEREKEGREVSWSLEGEARGRHIELEIEEPETTSE